jgi:hypothetical protein
MADDNGASPTMDLKTAAKVGGATVVGAGLLGVLFHISPLATAVPGMSDGGLRAKVTHQFRDGGFRPALARCKHDSLDSCLACGVNKRHCALKFGAP